MKPTEAKDSNSLEDLFRSADQAMRVGDLAQGKSLYRNILETHPDHLGAIVGLEFADYVEGGRKSRFHIPCQKTEDEIWRSRFANEEKNREEFQKGRVRLQSTPPSCHIEHTTKCNFYCPHCSKGYDPYPAADITGEVLDRFLEGLLPILFRINITGFGEPTIGARYVELMGKIIQAGAIPIFNTNTSTLTLGHIEMLVNAQAHITLSIDGASRETFETLRAGGSWDRLQKVFHGIQRIRSIYGAAGWWDITFVATRMNLHEIPQMVRITKRFGFDRLLVHDYYPVGQEFDGQAPSCDPETANRCFDEAESVAGAIGVQLTLPPRYAIGIPAPSQSQVRKFLSTRRIFPKPRRFPRRCDQPWVTTHINYHGHVTPCCFSNRSLGDLNSQDFHRIWNGWRYRWFRRRIQSFIPPPECRDCHVHEGINEGNPGNSKLGEGILLKVLYKAEAIVDGWRRKIWGREPDDTHFPKFFKGKLLKGNGGQGDSLKPRDG